MRLLLLAVGPVLAGPQTLPITPPPAPPTVVAPADHRIGTPLVAPPDLCHSVRCVTV